MGKSKLTKALFALLLIMLLALAACNGGDDGDAEADTDDSADTEETDDDATDEEADGDEGAEDDGLYSIEDFDQIKTNEGEAIEGGTFNFGLVSDTSFEGTLNWTFYSGNP